MYKRYERYKDSGIEWIGEIPEHWKKVKLKYLLKSIESGSRGLGGGNIDSGVFSIGGEHITWEGKIMTSPSKFITEDYYSSLNSGKVNWGDTLLVKDGATIGKTAYVEIKPFGECAVNEHVYILRSNNKILPKLLYYLVSGNLGFEQIKLEMRGAAQPGLNYGFTNKVMVPLIPLKEQKTIANFLDHKSSEIDSLIADKEKLIEKLEEYKQSIITEAVTKGLNPNVKMKDSGIEWIGEIPEHWEIIKLKYLGRCQNGVSKGAEYFGEGYPFVSYGDVYQNMELPSKINGLANSTINDRCLYSVREGDVFFTRTSETIDEIGIPSICMRSINNAIFSGFLIRFRPFLGKLDKKYSKYYFSSYLHRAYFVKEMNLVTRASLSQGLLKRLPVLVSPLYEQGKIGDYLEKLTYEVDAIVEKTITQINLIKQYRQSLIYEAVTGKIDIREYQPERSEQLA